MRARDSVVPFVARRRSSFGWPAIAFAWRWKRLPPAAQLIVAWLAVSMPGSLAGGHLSWHYFIQVMGPLALLAAFAIDNALDASRRRLVAGGGDRRPRAADGRLGRVRPRRGPADV